MPLLAPSASTITVFAANSVVGINESVSITAVVLESGGTPVQNGTVVTFATTLGTMDPVEVRTANGRASSTLKAGAVSGTAAVTAMSGSASAKVEGILVGAAAAASILLSANPTSVPATGGTVLLTATVVDASGNRLSGIPVNFRSTSGSLSATVVSSDANGEAQAQLTTSRDAEVTASAGGKQSNLTITATALPVVTLSTSTTTIQEGQPVTFSLSVQPGQNAFGIASVELDFGDGQSVALGGVTGTTAVSHVYSRAGTYRVTATATDTVGQRGTATAIIYVAEIPPLSVTLSSTGTAKVASPVNFTVSVTGTASLERVEWDFGDGARASTTGTQTSHVYTSPGLRVVKVTVFATNGASGFAQIEIVITAE